MQFNILTLFPKMFESPFAESIIKRAKEKNLIGIKLFDLRQWAVDNYGSVDDRPFGGEVGMLMRPEPVYRALKEITGLNQSKFKNQKSKFKIQKSKNRVILLTAGGKMFNQKMAEELSHCESITLVCGHYEGFDQRIHDFMVDEEISIGRYILTGGELPAMVVVDSVSRLLPGVLGKDESNKHESYSQTKVKGRNKREVESAQYTRPREFMGLEVPAALYSGDPKKIAEWKIKSLELKKSASQKQGTKESDDEIFNN